jgi:hypothetical protein
MTQTWKARSAPENGVWRSGIAAVKKNGSSWRAAGQVPIIPHCLASGKALHGDWHTSCIDVWCSTASQTQ